MTQVVQLDIDALRQELRGPVLGPEDTGYDEGRAVCVPEEASRRGWVELSGDG